MNIWYISGTETGYEKMIKIVLAPPPNLDGLLGETGTEANDYNVKVLQWRFA